MTLVPTTADNDLVVAAAHGDVAAFADVVKRHQGAVRAFLRRLCHDAGLADDIAQETFVQAHKALAGFRGEGSVRSWLMGIAWHRFLSDRRRVRRSREQLDEHDVAAAVSPRGVERTERSVERDVQRAMSVLSDDERAAIAACFANELTHEEAAVVLGMPLGTLKSHVARAKEKLRAALHAYAPVTSTPDGKSRAGEAA